MANGWGGKREGAGRRPQATDGSERKMRSLRASDHEWEIIKLCAAIIKKKKKKAEKILLELKNNK